MGSGYPSDWNARRFRVYRRDNYTCQECGRKVGHRGDVELHAHHIVPKGKGGSHKLKNLTTLCRSCHADAHSHMGAATHRPQKGFWGWAHRRADRELNELHRRCQNCGRSSLKARWERLEFRKKVKVLQCADCGTMFEEKIVESGGDRYLTLEAVSNVEAIEPATSAFRQQLEKTKVRRETLRRAQNQAARETFGACPNCGRDRDFRITDSFLTEQCSCESCGAVLKRKLRSKTEWKMTKGRDGLVGKSLDLLEWEQIVIEQVESRTTSENTENSLSDDQWSELTQQIYRELLASAVSNAECIDLADELSRAKQHGVSKSFERTLVKHGVDAQLISGLKREVQ